MSSLSTDPFSVVGLQRFRDFEITIIRPTQGTTDSTIEFASLLQAIQQISPNPPVKVPPSAAMFDFETISDYERKYPFACHPDYRLIRNFMVSTFRRFPNHYLPFTLCRRNIKAPVQLVYQIYQFLSEWGLINYKLDPKTCPPFIVPDSDKWPILISTLDEQLFSLNNFNKRLHPPPASKIPILIPQFHMMSSPYSNPLTSDGTNELPGTTTYPNWTREEIVRLTEAMKEGPTSWEDLAAKVKTKTPEECAAQITQTQIAVPFLEMHANQAFNKFHHPSEMMKQMVLADNPEMRIVYNTVKAYGPKQSYDVLNGNPAQNPSTEEQAAAFLAMQKISKNSQIMEKRHKQRILECLSKAVEVLKMDIEAKRTAIDDAMANHDNFSTDPGSTPQSESDPAEEMD